MKIDISGLDKVKAALARYTDAAPRAAAIKIAGRKVANLLKAHFLKKNATPNKDGFPRSNFWSQIRDATSTRADGNEAIVVVADPRFNLHLYGGTVTPKTAKALTIPLTDDAYNTPSSLIPDLFVIAIKGKGYLATNEDGHLSLKYLLVKSATIGKDPNALPPQAEIEKTAVDAYIGYFDRMESQGS